jgi:hypothetical protein
MSVPPGLWRAEHRPTLYTKTSLLDHLSTADEDPDRTEIRRYESEFRSVLISFARRDLNVNGAFFIDAEIPLDRTGGT